MKKSIFLIACLFSICTSAYSQGELFVVDRSVNPGIILDELGSKGNISNDIEEYFYVENWLDGSVYMNNNVLIKGYDLRYDILNSHVEIKVDGAIKICPAHYIEYFYLKDSGSSDSTKFVNASTLEFYETPLNGFFEVISEGEYSLLAFNKVEVLEPTYVPALDMGSKSKKVSTDKIYFIAKGDKVLCELENNSKKLSCPEMDDILPEDLKMKTKNEEQKIEFINYLNSI